MKLIFLFELMRNSMNLCSLTETNNEVSTDVVDLDLNFYLDSTEDSGLVGQNHHEVIPGRQRSRSSHELHKNTKNLAGMLRFRLAALGIKSPPFTEILRYGCWCSFLLKQEKRPKNMEPVDEIDKLCRKRSKCHECASLDRFILNILNDLLYI